MKNGNFEGSWEKERRDTLKAEMVTPSGYKHLGWLKGIVSASILEDYDSDTRIQGTVSTTDPDSYIDLSMIRLIHESRWPDGSSSMETLGTFFVVRTGDNWKSGTQQVTFELKSVLYGMKDDLAPEPLTLASGSYGIDAFAKICSLASRPKTSLVQKQTNRRISNLTLKAGESYLKWLHEVAENDGRRIEVSESGYVLYTDDLGAKKAPSMSIAAEADCVIASGIRVSSDETVRASRSIVTWDYQYEEQIPDGTYKSDYTDSYGVRHAKGSPKLKKTTAHKAITAYADVDQGDRAHIGRRGWRKSVYHKYSGDEYSANPSVSEAQMIAKNLLPEDAVITAKWEIPMLYLADLHAGQVIRWKPPGETEYRRCLVTKLSKELMHYTMKATLTEV